MAIAALIYRPPGFAEAKRVGAELDRSSAYKRGYGGRHWELMRRATFLRDNYVCQECGELCVEGHSDAGRWPNCDHIVPKPEGMDEPGNLQTLCGACHGYKTRKETRGGGAK